MNGLQHFGNLILTSDTLFGDSDLAPVDRFLKEMGLSGVTPQPKLAVTKTNLPPSSQVFLLEYPR